ncbi:MAG: endonuclease III [Pseudorhodoplanes sp.]
MARKTTRKNAKSAGRPAIKRKAALKAAKAGKAAKRKRTSAQAEADQKALHGDLKPWTREEVTEAFRRFQKVDPAPKGELQHINPFTLLVAVVLSAQATDAGVNKATPALFAVAANPQEIVRLGEDKVRDFIKTIGLYRNKAKNVIALSEKLIAEHGGEVPREREALEALPGVGRKTANVVLNMAFGQPTMAVDTHVFRVSNRTGLAPGKNPLEVELKLVEAIPEEFMMHAHHWLILHGRYTCVARRPKCGQCPVFDLCGFKKKAEYVE